jgi:RNA polymerase sigma factor (sigma-70 family)
MIITQLKKDLLAAGARKLTKQEEASLSQKAMDGCEEARHTLIMSQAFHALQMVSRNHLDVNTMMDKFQSAMLGVMRASKLFRSKHSTRLSTYARLWMINFLQEEIRKNRFFVVPQHVYYDYVAARKANPKHKAAAKRLMESELMPLEEWCPGADECDPAVQADDKDTKRYLTERVNAALATLTPRERFILRALALDLKISEVARILQRTPQAVRKLAERSRHRIRPLLEDLPGKYV